MCVTLSVCVSAFLFGTRLGSGLLQSHIPPAPLCSVLQKIFAFSTTHNFSSSIATRCGPCGPGPHGNGGSSSPRFLLWRLPWELALLQARGGGEGVHVGQGGCEGSQQLLLQMATWVMLGVGGAPQPGPCLASRPQHLTCREASGKSWELNVQEAPLLFWEAPT